MNASTSDYSSGCESGWTMYLDQISNSYAYTRDFYTKYEDNDDEDQSMVSDASSGPPPHSYGCAAHEDNNAKTKTCRKEPKQKQPLCLDDTASSSIFRFPHQGNVPLSDDSAPHFEGQSVTKKRLSFFKSSTKGKSGSAVGRKRQ